MQPLPPPPAAIVNAAVSTSATDNIAAINAAIATAALSGTGLVLLPPGTFPIAPTSTSWIALKSGVTIQGAGPATVLKVKNNAGDYPTIFAPAAFGTALSNVVIRDLAVDQNPSGNTTCNIAAGAVNQAQYAVYATNCTNVTIERVLFDACCGINTVALSGTNVADCWVRSCVFRFTQGAATAANYDNSAIYFNGRAMHAIGNKFYSTIAQNARGCCEFHSGLGSFVGNVANGYNTLINIVTASQGATDLAANNIVVGQNVLLNGGKGIALWSATGQTLRGVSIVGNALHIAQIDWNEVASAGISLTYQAGTTLAGAYDTLDISHNLVTFQAGDTRTTAAGGASLAYASTYGIGLKPKGNVSNVAVRGNIVVNSPIYGIYLGNSTESNTSTNVAIEDNLIVDNGSNSATVATRSAIIVTANLTDVSIERNRVRDTGASALIGQNWIAASSGLGTCVNVAAFDNKVSSVSGTLGQSFDKSKISDRTRKASAWSPGPIAAGAAVTTTVTIVDAATTDTVVVTPSGQLEAGLVLYGYVSAASTVTLVLVNPTAGSITPAARTYRARVSKTQIDA